MNTRAEEALEDQKSSFYITNKIEPSVYDSLKDKTFREVMSYITKLSQNATPEQLEIQSTIQGFVIDDQSEDYIADLNAQTTKDRQYNVLQIMCKNTQGEVIRSPDGLRPFAVLGDGISPYISEISVDDKALDHLDMALAIRLMNARR